MNVTIRALRECVAEFEDDDTLEKVWETENGQKLLKQVSLLVRRNESRRGQASIAPRVRALRAMTQSGMLDPPPHSDISGWSQNPTSFWTISFDFNGRREINMIYEDLGSRFQMMSHLDVLDRSLRIRKRFLCLFFYDFVRLVHPTAERLGAAIIQSTAQQLELCGVHDIDLAHLKVCMSAGRRLDELVRRAGAGALLCLPKEADDMDRLEQLGEMVPDLAQWLVDTGLQRWSHETAADALGNAVRKLILDSATSASPPNQPLQSYNSMNNLDLIFAR